MQGCNGLWNGVIGFQTRFAMSFILNVLFGPLASLMLLE